MIFAQLFCSYQVDPFFADFIMHIHSLTHFIQKFFGVVESEGKDCFPETW